MRMRVFLLVAVVLGGAESARAADDGVSRGVLERWLAAASTGPEAPPSLTTTPFEYHTTNAKKRCEGTFKDAKALAGWWKCFKKAENYLLTDFQNGGRIEPPSPAGPPPRALAKLAKRIKTPGTWAQGVFTGDGMISQFLFLTTESGQIAALLVDVDFF